MPTANARFYLYYSLPSGVSLKKPSISGLLHNTTLKRLSVPVYSPDYKTTSDPNSGILVREFTRLNLKGKILKTEIIKLSTAPTKHPVPSPTPSPSPSPSPTVYNPPLVPPPAPSPSPSPGPNSSPRKQSGNDLILFGLIAGIVGFYGMNAGKGKKKRGRR
ncbi:MAG: hypothetical protein KDK36_06235 [Leptospiraceae bacterium]|nr:hypothetical protein [Leptospiraceae bacterium]